MNAVAVVFVRRSGADGIGHVGWAFGCGDQTFNAGSVENPHHTLHTQPQKMGFWTIRTRDPIAPMREHAYNEFKVIELAHADPGYAWRVVAWASRKPYDVFGRNCMDVTYDVLRAYGVPHLPVPAHHWEPNHWFDRVQGRHYEIDADGVGLEAGGPKQTPPGPDLPDLDSLLTGPPVGIEPTVPSWRTPNTSEWFELQAAIAAAPAMPATERHRMIPEQHRIMSKIRHLFGIEQADK
jgi:hypothetical protein